MRALLLTLTCLFTPLTAFAAEGSSQLDLAHSWVGYLTLVLFVLAYVMVVLEEWSGMRKSIPVMVAALAIWVLIGAMYAQHGDQHFVAHTIRESLLEYAEVFLFLLVAMTYINSLEERGVFDALRAWLLSRGFSLRTIFWLTGVLAFFISPVADNMTTALVMASVALAVGKDHPRFVVVSCISIVVAANAGGAWSPFGDITTLMVWQKGKLDAAEFLVLLLPSMINWLVPAAILSFAVPNLCPEAGDETITIRKGGFVIILMFIGTIAMTVTLHSTLHVPPVLGMMGGLGLLKLYSWFLNRSTAQMDRRMESEMMARGGIEAQTGSHHQELNVFNQVARAEWDTLLFFYGIMMCVGGLGTIGYLALGSEFMYGDLGPWPANILVGVISAIIDNIPVMYAVLTMNPAMSDGHWLLVTLTAGVGGSLLSIGSAAGVAVMGQAHGKYTFFAHLRWSWAVALGYAASIAFHYWVNGDSFKLVHAATGA
ncbi:sodium:proton antiporter [Sinimarinibacterium sp. CAU 1509]|uniref:sodium:proton antiporter NhaD n=1 Tax=Sinimarinibacterium sp. CAU 1509 TaxID=2562283 RepID=UPI0010AB99A3|nr:sodium:proton antiporter NhaD [Sinimarinibacterium sp. CAU 1509]TJY59416.1 sodium:proton antiporter [Sinimarinibacterium sp. CAU 1509]